MLKGAWSADWLSPWDYLSKVGVHGTAAIMLSAGPYKMSAYVAIMKYPQLGFRLTIPCSLVGMYQSFGARHWCTDGKLVATIYQTQRCHNQDDQTIYIQFCNILHFMHPNDYTYTRGAKTFLNLIQQLLEGRDQLGSIKSSRISESQTSESIFNVKRPFASKNLRNASNIYKM